MNARSFLRRDITLATAVPYFLLILLLPFLIQPVQVAAHWIGAEWKVSRQENVAQLRNEMPGDFRTFWAAGKYVLSGHAANDYLPNAQAITESQTGIHVYRWFYPPPTLLLMPLTTFGGIRVGCIVWTISLLVLSIAILRWASITWIPIGMTLCSPAVISSIDLGQLGLVTGASFFAAILMAGQRPKQGGVLIGTLAFKPQSALIGPVVLLARRNYTGLFAATLMVLMLCVVTTMLLGWHVWLDFLRFGTATEKRTLVGLSPNGAFFTGASIFWMLSSFHLSPIVCLIGQLAVAGLVIVWCWRAWREPASDLLALAALTACLTLLITPYAYTDDMCGYTLGIILLAWQRRRLDIADVALIMWPGMCPLVTNLLDHQITPVFILWAALRASNELRLPIPVASTESMG